MTDLAFPWTSGVAKSLDDEKTTPLCADRQIWVTLVQCTLQVFIPVNTLYAESQLNNYVFAEQIQSYSYSN